MPWNWTTVTVVVNKAGTTPPPPPAQAITSFAADTTSITQGQSVNLSWATSNATAVRLNGQTVAASGSQAVTPTTTTSYLLEADGAAATVSQTLAVTVALQPPVNPSGTQGRLVLVGANTMWDVLPTYTAGGAWDLGVMNGSMSYNGIISNGGFAFAPNLGLSGSLVLFGGGHNDHGGNEVLAFDLATFRWTLLSNPSTSVRTSAQSASLDCWANPSTTYGELLDGSPMAAHGFGTISVIPGGTNGKGRMLRICGASLGVGDGRTSAPSAHVADLGVTPPAAPTAIWSRFSSNHCTYLNTGNPVPYGSTYDVANNCVWGIYPGGVHGALTKLDLGMQQYTNYTTTYANWGLMPHACAHPVRGLALFVSGYYDSTAGWNSPQTMHLNAVDLANPTAGMTRLTTQGDVVPASRLAPLGTYLSPFSIDWDTDGDVGYITSGDEGPTHLYKVTPPAGNYLTSSWTLTKIALPASLPLLAPDLTDPTRTNLDVIYGHWRYCPSIKAFAYLAHTGKDKARFPDDGKLALWYPA